jgi:peptidoglycan/xylan/chitin deacetylase (PgdA/CDA1 family)
MGAHIVFTCSIDDGHPLDLKTAELLDKHGLKATFFVPIKNREGLQVMPRERLRDLSQQFEIGSHTYDHCYLRDLDVRRTYYQIAHGKSRLEDLIGNEVAGFCYPGGKYRDKDIALVKACGFRYARTTANLFLDAGRRPFEMPTTVQFYPHRPEVYVRNFIRYGHWIKRGAPLWMLVQEQDWMKRLHRLFDHACEHGGTFHLWGHSKQIEELRAWPQLNAFFGHVASRVGESGRLTNAQVAARMPAVDSVQTAWGTIA